MLLKKVVRLYFLILVLIIGVTNARSQKMTYTFLDTTRHLSQYVLENWTKVDGLPTNYIKHITQTEDGYIWLTTPSGLVRFDGTRFVTFNTTNSQIPSENLVPVTAGSNNDLWVGSFGSGLIHYKDGIFTSYTTKTETDNDVLYLEIDKNDSIWTVGHSGLYKLKERQLEKIILPAPYSKYKVMAMGKDIKENIWVLLENGTLFNCHNSKVIHTGINTSSSKNVIWVTWYLLFDKEGHPWIEKPEAFAQNNLIYIQDNNIRYITKDDGLPSNAIRNLYKSKNGTIWVGTNDGISRIYNGKIDYMDEKTGVPDNRTQGIFEDREGNIWFGSYGGGLSRFKNSVMTSYTTSQGIIDNKVHCIFQKSDSSIWVGTENGLNKWEKGRFSIVPFSKGLPIRSIGEDDNGALWVGSSKSRLFIYSENKVIKKMKLTGDLESDVVKTIYNDPISKNQMWIGTSKGLNLFNDYKKELTYDFGYISSILRTADSALWCSTTTKGLYRLKNTVIHHFTAEDKLNSNTIKDLYEDDAGNLWIGSKGGGLIHYKDGEFTFYSREDGLETNDVWGIAKDKNGFLWLSCDEGIRKVATRDLLNYDRNVQKPLSVKVYGSNDGMESIECNSFGYPPKLVDLSGAIWFPTMGGVARANPYQKQLHQSPKVKVQKLTTSDQTYIHTSDFINLSSEKRNIKIDYTSIFYGDPKLVSYAYKLQGYDTDWQTSNGRTSAFYTNLPPGKFTFNVKIINKDNLWEASKDQITFSIEPYFYETRLFYFLSSVSILIILYWVFKFSIQSIKKRNSKLQTLNQKLESTNTELEQKNAEMERFNYTVSHDLKSPLITIKGFLGMIKEDLETKDLPAISEDLHHIDQAASRMNDLLEELLELSRVGRVVNEFRTVPIKDIIDQAVENIQGSLNKTNLSVENNMPLIHCDEKRMIEVFQNLLENAIKFTGNQNDPFIKIGAVKKETYIKIFVRDNGIGIKKEFQKRIFNIFERLDQDIDGTGIGLALVKRVIEVHNGKVWAESDGIGKGTTFYFIIPVKKASKLVPQL